MSLNMRSLFTVLTTGLFLQVNHVTSAVTDNTHFRCDTWRSSSCDTVERMINSFKKSATSGVEVGSLFNNGNLNMTAINAMTLRSCRTFVDETNNDIDSIKKTIDTCVADFSLFRSGRCPISGSQHIILNGILDTMPDLVDCCQIKLGNSGFFRTSTTTGRFETKRANHGAIQVAEPVFILSILTMVAVGGSSFLFQ